MLFTNSDNLKDLFEAQGLRRWEIAKTTCKQRIEKLKKLRKAIVRRQEEFYDAIWKDFHKSRFESWLCEIFPTIEEIDEAIKNLHDWMEDKPGSWVFFLPTNKSTSHFEPKGRVLIMAPWNYPFLLFVSPIVSAIAAGNVVIAKPSHKTPNVSAFLASLFEEIFEPSEVAVIEGPGTRVGDELLQLPFDHVFFTGSPKVGAHVGEMSQRIHASLTLELGGKSPVIILDDVNIEDAAKKIAWGKTLNAGQTCIAPDYVLCPRPLMEPLAKSISNEIKKMFGETAQQRKDSEDFVHIIESRAVERHQALIQDAIEKGATEVLGGECDIENRYTPATVLVNVTAEMAIMDSEIFGPILPFMAYDNVNEAIRYVQEHPKPLALYIFGKSESKIDNIINQTSSGSTCVNHCILQIENLSVPFGGVGMSGTGNYHGIYGFKTFSHERNIMRQGPVDAVRFFFPPYHKKGNKGLFAKIQSFSERGLNFIKSMGTPK